MRVTYPSMFVSLIRNAMRRDGLPELENVHTCATGTVAYFTDSEHDNQRYRLTVEPIRPEQECKFGEE